MANNVRASFDVTSAEGKLKAFNAMNGSSKSLKNLSAGEVISVIAVMQYDDVVDSYGSDQEATITVLFDDNGESYAGVSETVAKAASNLMDLLEDGDFESIKVVVDKQKSSRGQEFINLRAVL